MPSKASKMLSAWILCFTALHSHLPASSSTYLWHGTGSSDDLSLPVNWVPNRNSPAADDFTNFDNTISSINLTPTSNGVDFSVDSIHFLHLANLFTFTFNKCTLSLNGYGITGLYTDATFNLNNIDNVDILQDNLFLSSNDNSLGKAKIFINNIGSLSGSETSSTMSNIGSSHIDVSGILSMESEGALIVVNKGTDDTTNGGDNSIAKLAMAQAYIDGSVDLENQVLISFVNEGNSNGTNNTASSSVGRAAKGGFYTSGSFNAGNDLSFSLFNKGNDASTGVGGNSTGFVAGTAQLHCDDTFNAGNNASISIFNTGNCSGTTSLSGNLTGYEEYQQMYVANTFTAGDNLTLLLSNSGIDSSSGVGDNYTGVIGACQLKFSSNVTMAGKKNAFITASNKGVYSGTSTGSTNLVGCVNASQIQCEGTFTVGDNLSLFAFNSGENHSTSANLGQVGYVSGSQIKFYYATTVGNKASIAAYNQGITTISDTSNVGYLDEDQIHIQGPFTAGTHLSMVAFNNATTSGGTTTAGYVQSQIAFIDSCAIGDGSVISASNLGSGIVNGSQLLFQQGFDIDGTATLQAINESSVGRYGIEVQNGAGGNAKIILGNSSFYISSPQANFTIASLSGDETSLVQSLPILIINTPSAASANFSGNIQNFAGPSDLIKMGSGTQQLSGTNTYTGSTTVDDGTLIVTGSIAGALQINASGTLKGTGSIEGAVANAGTISPGESIGTLHFLSDFTTTGGTYNVEVSGTGATDLIDVGNDAFINGGLIAVSSIDGTYKFKSPYTILTAGGARSGFYSGAAAPSLLMQPSLTYDAQHVYLTLFTDIELAARTANQRTVARQLDGISDPTDNQNLLLSALIDLPISFVPKALDRLSGWQHNVDLITAFMVNRQFLRKLYTPLRPIASTEPCCHSECCLILGDLWVDVGGTCLNINGKCDQSLNARGSNVAFGGQATFLNLLTIGIAGEYEKDYLKFNGGNGNEKCKHWLAGLYALYRPSCFYGLLDFAFDHSANSLNRSINIGSWWHDNPKSHPNTTIYTFYGELGLDVYMCGILMQPFAGVEVANFHRKHVHESDFYGFGLDVKKREQTLTTTRLGIHMTASDFILCGSSLCFDFGWNYLVSTMKNRVHEQFDSFGTPFIISWNRINRNVIDYALTLTTPLSCNLIAYVEGSGEYYSNANVVSLFGGLEFSW